MWFTLFLTILLATEAVGVADPAFSIVMNVTGWSPMFANVTGPVYNDNSPSRVYCYAIISPEPWCGIRRRCPRPMLKSPSIDQTRPFSCFRSILQPSIGLSSVPWAVPELTLSAVSRLTHT